MKAAINLKGKGTLEFILLIFSLKNKARQKIEYIISIVLGGFPNSPRSGTNALILNIILPVLLIYTSFFIYYNSYLSSILNFLPRIRASVHPYFFSPRFQSSVLRLLSSFRNLRQAGENLSMTVLNSFWWPLSSKCASS